MEIRSWENTLIDMVPPWPEQGGHFYCVKTGHFYCRSTVATPFGESFSFAATGVPRAR
jgi:hypothetical protein